MVDAGGWLLLSMLFALALLVVQRAERSRRLAALVIMGLAASLIYGYGIYRLTQNCGYLPPLICDLPIFAGRLTLIAYSTTNLAVIFAIVVNLLFWAFIGRYNPPGTSDDIRVLGLND